MKSGDALFLRLPDGTKHLYVVLTDVDSNGDVAIVNVSTDATWKDQSCKLQPGEHKFIKTATVLMYYKAKLFPARLKTNMMAAGDADEWDPVAPDILKRIRQGALDS